MARTFRFLIGLFCIGLGAAHSQDTYPLRPQTAQSVLDLVQAHPSLLGLRVDTVIGQTRSPQPDCAQAPKVSFSGRGRPWGQFSVTVQCSAPVWTLRVPVKTRVFGSTVYAARPLSAGTVIAKEDVLERDGEITRSAADAARSLAQVVGKELAQAIPKGAPLGLNKFRVLAVIKKGEKVMVSIKSPGFQVSGEGVAMGPGQVGDLIEIRMAGGQVVRGQVVRPGVAEVFLD